MIKQTAAVGCCLLPIIVCSIRAEAFWINWKSARVPLVFKYEHRPAWCVDKDPFCETLRGWCLSKNTTQSAYVRKACRRTCDLCYEGMNYTETCFDIDDDCPLKENDCYSEATAKLMYESCARTCGFCNQFCADTATNCAQLTTYCMAPGSQAIMRSKCRMSCSFCRVYDIDNFEAPVCYDREEHCTYRKHICDSPNLQEMMRQDCAHSCGYCDYFDSVEDVPRECVDTDDECSSKRHLCYVQGRESTWMWRNCPRTCGYCPHYYFNKEDN